MMAFLIALNTEVLIGRDLVKAIMTILLKKE